MAWQDLLTAHSVDVLAMQTTMGAAAAPKRIYNTVSRVLKCRMVPLNVQQRVLLGRLADEVSHICRSIVDPQLRTGDRIGFPATGLIGAFTPPYASVIMRIIVPYNAHELNRVWRFYAKALPEDNPTLAELK